MEKEFIQEISECFGLIFLLERRFEHIFDKALTQANLTTKQWLVLAAIEKSGKEKPSIQEVAKQLSTSHQNIKAICSNLQKHGFVLLEKDQRDKRITRIVLTFKNKTFWKERENEDRAGLLELFKHLSSQEKLVLRQILSKLLQGAEELADKINTEREG